MTERVSLEIPLLLPDAPDAQDRCVARLMTTLGGAPGMERVHLVADDATEARLCLHLDPAVTTVARVRELAETTGAALTDRFRHVVWPVAGVGRIRKARGVADALRRIDGVVEAEVTPGLVRLEFDQERVTESDLRTALARRRVTVTPPEEHHDDDAQHHHGGVLGERTELTFAIASASFWTVGFVLGLATGVAEPTLTFIFVVAGLLGGFFTAREALESVRNGRFEIDFLMLIAAAGAAVLGKWEEGALLLALFSVGHALEGYAMGRARRAIEALADLVPDTAMVRRDDVELEVAVEDLRIGDVVVVRPNERIPADGFVISGTSSVNQAPLTGESIPVDKSPVPDRSAAAADPDRVPPGSKLFSGTINGAGQMDLVVARRAVDSSLSRLATMVRDAETQTSPTQRFTDRFERIFVPAVLALVVVVLVVGPATGEAWSDSFYRAMAVLVAASPCALAIATPSAVLAAIARAGQLGVLIKGGGPLEALGRARAIAFDKTGTLTEGRPTLTDIAPIDGVSIAELMSIAAAVEARSDHPLAAAITRDAASVPGLTRPPVEAVTAITGRGIRATVDGRDVLIGNEALFDDQGGIPPGVQGTVEALQAAGRTIMIVKAGDQFVGTLGLMDTPRSNARSAVAALQTLGVRRAVVLSGDHQAVADAIAREVGLTDAWGDLMPEDKVRAIERLRQEVGDVAMVGDGVNDAPALAHATVGIAMGAAGSDVALETADVALMGDDLAKLPVVVGLGRSASRVIRQNLLLSLGMVAVLIPATIVGVVGIGLAVVFHEGSTLIVVVNALRLLGYERSVAGPATQGAAP